MDMTRLELDLDGFFARGSYPVSSLGTSIAIRGSGVAHVAQSGSYSLPAPVPLPVPVPVSVPVPPTGAVSSV